jgi:hypothetical protein
MPNILYPPSRPQSVGEVLDSGFRVFGATLVGSLGYSLGAMLIGQLPSIYALVNHRAITDRTLVFDPRWWGLIAVALVGGVILTSALIVRQYEIASGKTLAAGGPLAVALRRLGGMLLMVLIAALALTGCVVPLMMIVGAIAGVAGTAPALIGVIGFLVALIPASWLMVRWLYAGWVLLLTGAGATASLRQSWRLTLGSFWRLSAILTVAVMVALVLYLLSFIFTGILSMLFGYRDVAVVTAVGTVVILLLRVVITPFYTALGLAAYGDLTVRREGADLDQRISASG